MFREVIIGLINVFMGVDIFEILANGRTEVEKLGKALLTTASALLVLGTLFAQKQHRANILLIWLTSSLIYFGTHFYSIRKCYSCTCTSLWIYAILLVCMTAVIYKAYTKELEKSKDKKSSVGEKQPTPTAPEESHPPIYNSIIPQVHVY
ncbi:uncharacterized protein [Drosophila kikkawai]|uniref:Uncharacterized protein n=1 Tax=Drosophila kikkawai TaxID=30033 RepID=A0A6P4JF07_DROKI|nr:uncharacterized protein LOC108082345 [Drosophila kikkawai]